MTKEKKINKIGGIKIEDCAEIANVANKFTSSVYIIKSNKKVNAKSIMGIISLGMKQGEVIKISTAGADDYAAMDAILSLFS